MASDSTKGWIAPVLDIVAGTLGGTAGKLIEFPFDTLKVRLQAGGVGLLERYDGTMDAIKKIFRREGARGFFRGMSLPLAGTIVETSCLFTTNGFLKRTLREGGHLPPDADLPLKYVLVSGAGTGFVVSWVLTPIELIKCRLQVPLLAGEGGAVTSHRYTGPLDCFRRSVQAEGISVLYRGHTGTMLREVPGTMCWFGAYETFVRWMTPPGKTRTDLHPMTIVTAGALGGMSYWAIMYPCDTVKSAMQITPTQTAPLPSAAAAAHSAPMLPPPLAAGAAFTPVPASPSPAGGARYSAASATGLGAQLLRDLPPHLSGSGPAGVPGSAPAAAFSTSAASAIDSAAASSHHRPKISHSFVQTFQSIYRAQGLRGLYSGLTPTMLRAAPSNAAIFLVYEWSVKHLNKMVAGTES